MVSPSMSPEGATGANDLPAVMELVADVDGWMTPGQAATLFDAARRCPPTGSIVEIGSFRGRSTIVLASAAPPDARIVAIDPHAGNDRGPQEIDPFFATLEFKFRPGCFSNDCTPRPLRMAALPNPAIEVGVAAASEPPVTITSARSHEIRRAAYPMA